jgi:hypothetical protein
MAWSSLASNQMVSYTDAQGGGFTLNSGQSSVTSNQCMTKNDALTKYNLDSSYMSAYASNQLVPKSTWVSAAPAYDLYNADVYDCSSYSPTGTTVVAFPTGTSVSYSLYYISPLTTGVFAYKITSTTTSGPGIILDTTGYSTVVIACNII